MQILILLFMFLSLNACSDHGSDPKLAPTAMEIHVHTADSQQTIANAYVVVYDSLNQAIGSGFTNTHGVLTLELPIGIYHLQVDGSGYLRFPRVGGVTPLVQVLANQTVQTHVIMDKDSSNAGHSLILGKVQAISGQVISGARVIAFGNTGIFEIHSDKLGRFALYNIPKGDYQLRVLIAGYEDTLLQSIHLDSAQIVQGLVLAIKPVIGTQLSVNLSFLATQNGRVDLSLVDPWTLLPIPGLVGLNDSGSTIKISGIAPGQYQVWASYQNDGYVMDPDWIRKFGIPVLTVKPGDTLLQMPISLTGADTLISPTNMPSSALAQDVRLDTLQFKWSKYPSAKEYFIEVRNSKGVRIWGGIDSVKSLLAQSLDARTTSCKFNFDGTALETLKVGEIYHWKIWADRDAAQGIQGLITSSEDQMGYFRIIP